MNDHGPRPGYETLALERIGDHVLKVVLNRPAAANALNTRMGRDLLHLWRALTDSPGDTRAVVMTGAGERVFCAGGDLKERSGMTDEAWERQHEIFERAVLALLDCPLPIIAAVNGAAFGGGLEIALCADFIYAADHARFALPEATLGIIPGAGGTQTLARAAGERRAKEIIMTGRPFGAAEALDWGIVNRVFPGPGLLEAALGTADTIARNAPLSVRQAKRSIHYGLQGDLRSGMRFEIEAYNRLPPMRDRREGVDAFNERRAPRFEGR